jgi:hypothetical protein
MTFLFALLIVLGFCLIIGGMAWIWSCIEWRCEVRRRIRERDCVACAKRGTLLCPNSYLCYSRKDKPYFELSEEYGRKCNGK